MRLLLLDRIVELTPWKTATGIKLVSASEDFLDRSGDGPPVLPPGLALECAFQTAAWLIVISSEMALRPAIVTVRNVVWEREIVAGDRLETRVVIQTRSEDAAEVSGEAFVDGERVLSLESGICSLLGTAQLDPPGAAEWMTGQLLRGAGPVAGSAVAG
jgi:3-hydroxymyristoyl/3-hydroxydecanoyl-(acyl carrier protein) dehydratase